MNAPPPFPLLRMKINVKCPPWETCGQKQKKKWFAWRPVWTEDGYLVWLETIMKDRYVTEIGVLNRYYYSPF